MRRTIELDGLDWTLEGFVGLDGARNAAMRAGVARTAAIPASVPGSVLHDVWRAGQVEDPYVGLNSLAAEWIPRRAWLYRRRVVVPPVLGGGRARLRFDGLDHAGEVFWDGEPVARHEGMFVPFEIDLTDPLEGGLQRPGRRRGQGPNGGASDREHELAVVVDPAPESEPQVGRTSRVRAHKSRMGYGWDFCPPMIHQGLWQSVRLEVDRGVRIADVWARPRLAADLGAATVDVSIMLDCAVSRRVRLQASLEGESAARAEPVDVDAPAGRSEIVLQLAARQPALWWPNGLGLPVVHRLVARALDDDGSPLDEASVPVGFRSIERVPNEGAPGGARPWTWVVNGRRVYIRGWNWVPVDAQYGVPRPDRLGHLVRLARDANVNLLRVWGGGLIETRAFYDACDAAGILVWQEFAQSSSGIDSVPSDDPEFVARMAAEAEVIVPLRRNHPSLAAWCGGNELEGPSGPLDDTTPVIGALREVVERLDPDRAWLPTSPSGPRFHNRLDVIQADPDGLHDVHGPWEHQGLEAQHALYDRGASLFNSEFGVEGMTNRRTHEALVPADVRWPATRANRVYRHLGDWWINEPLVQACFGGRLDDLESLRRASQRLQADGLRYAVEANRRRAFRNSGSIPWQLNESYPNAWCTSAIDHRGDPKPAYHAVRRAYAPVVVAAQLDRVAWGGRDGFRAGIWAWADDAEGRGLDGVRVAARLLDADGGAFASAELEAATVGDRPVRLGDLEWPAPLPAVFVLDLALAARSAGAAAEVGARSRYLLSGAEDLGPWLDVAPAHVDATVSRQGSERWDVRLRHAGGPVAIGLRVEDDRPMEAPGWSEVDDGGFELLPGEARSVAVRWAADDPSSHPRRLRLGGWNVAEQGLTA